MVHSIYDTKKCVSFFLGVTECGPQERSKHVATMKYQN